MLEDDPLWYKDAIIYQAHVRAFQDSDADGVGDFKGLASRLDYLRELGVTAVWLLPFYPSPLRDDGYDISDYGGVHPDYGTLADFRMFLREAHRKGLRVITELVVNHTSDQHPWFQRARRAPKGSKERDFYVWSDTADRYKEARIIFKDFEVSNWSWDPVANAYFWHRFYSHQPDLNYNSAAVRRAVSQAMGFWLGMGVDGLRLDAVPYLHEKEGTSCENLPQTHKVLRELRSRVDRSFKNKMLLAEANQWPEDVLPYFGSGDECHMAFNFPLMPRMFMAMRMEDRYPIIDILGQTPPVPEGCQWAVFLRNHDELTLEMVTDEERDYMYRVYATDPRARINLGIRRRLAPLLENNRRRIELMNGLLLSMPGTPVIYYGDEIGMGDNIYLGDRNGVRTPMQWSTDRNAGFSKANSQRLFLPVIIDPEFHYEAVNVEAQQGNPSSLLNWMRRLISLRRRYKAFGRGSLEFLYPENRKILCFMRSHENERILVAANLSRHSQYVEIDLSACKGLVPVELMGGTPFPPIGDRDYLLTLGPHSFYWFSLERASAPDTTLPERATAAEAPRLRLKGKLVSVFSGLNKAALEKALPDHIRRQRWFGRKTRSIESVAIRDLVPIGADGTGLTLAIVTIEYGDIQADTYLLAMRILSGGEAESTARHSPGDVIAQLSAGDEEGLLIDAARHAESSRLLLDAVTRKRRFKGTTGEVRGTTARGFRHPGKGLDPRPLKGEQSNTSIVYGDRLIMKIYRKLGEGISPDYSIGTFLTQRTSFANTPGVAGALDYHVPRSEPVTLAILQDFVQNQGDAWSYSLDMLNRTLERLESRTDAADFIPEGHLIDVARKQIPRAVREVIGLYLESARLIGIRTAEMHMALASGVDDPAFSPEPFTPFYQRSLYQSMRNRTEQTFEILRKQVKSLPEGVRGDARDLLRRQDEVHSVFSGLRGRALSVTRIRIHGDYHLGQVLHTGKDFIIIDFEGEPDHTLSTRRLKRCPLRDVAGMLRSFDYAASSVLLDEIKAGRSEKGHPGRELWAQVWVTWASVAFLRAYFSEMASGALLPRAHNDQKMLLDCFLMEKALYEVAYELENRPDWVWLPLRGIGRLLASK